MLFLDISPHRAFEGYLHCQKFLVIFFSSALKTVRKHLYIFMPTLAYSTAVRLGVGLLD